MAEESARPPTITTPVGHMCTCEHPACVSAGLRLRSTEGCCENAAGTLKMLASAWTLAEDAGECWQILMACECAGIAGRMKTIIPHPDVEPAPLSGWFFLFLFSFVRICFHLLFHYAGLLRLFWFYWYYSIILFLLFLWWIWELVLFASAGIIIWLCSVCFHCEY